MIVVGQAPWRARRVIAAGQAPWRPRRVIVAGQHDGVRAA
jgi:hypothetical protein